MSNPGRDSPLPRRTPCPHAAAIDVGSEMHVAAVGADAAAQPELRQAYTSQDGRIAGLGAFGPALGIFLLLTPACGLPGCGLRVVGCGLCV